MKDFLEDPCITDVLVQDLFALGSTGPLPRALEHIDWGLYLSERHEHEVSSRAQCNSLVHGLGVEYKRQLLSGNRTYIVVACFGKFYRRTHGAWSRD
jgi:hypothetical protein